MKTRRICLYAAAGAGKSTSAAFLFSEFKRKKFGPSVELVQEYAKRWAWTNRQIRPEDQLYIFSEQLKLEEELLSAGVDLVITDSPIWLSVFYGSMITCPYTQEIKSICQKFDEQYPALNVFIDRGMRQYDTRGRYQDLTQAKTMDTGVLELLTVQKLPYLTTVSEDFEGLWEVTVDALVKTGTIQLNENLIE